MTDILRSLWADARPWLLGLIFGWALGACLCSCTTTRQANPPAPEVPAVALDTTAVPPSATRPWPDSVYGGGSAPALVVVPHRTALDKVLGRHPKPRAYQPAANLTINTGKKATIYNNTGPGQQSVSTAAKNAAAGPGATAAAKASGPVAGWDAVAQDYTKQGGKGGTVASGAGSAATGPVAAAHKPGWLAWVLHRWWLYVGLAIVGLVLFWPLIGPSLLLLLGVAGRALAQGLAWFFALFKRRQQPVAAAPVAPAPETPPAPSPLPVAVAAPVAPAPVVAAEPVVYPVTPTSPASV